MKTEINFLKLCYDNECHICTCSFFFDSISIQCSLALPLANITDPKTTRPTDDSEKN